MSLTVVLPARNAEATIAAAIRSILWQTYDNFEFWILENGSTDRTAEIARRFTRDPRVKVFELGPVGFQGALEFGLRNTTTDWIARMDADDVCFPDRLEKQMAFLSANPQYSFVGTAFAVLTPSSHILLKKNLPGSRPVDKESLDSKGNRSWFYADPSVIFNRSSALAVGGYDPEFKMGDQPLWFRLLEGGLGYEMAEPLYVYRSVPLSMNFGMYHNDVARMRNKYLKRNYPATPIDLVQRNNKFWSTIATFELLAGDGKSARYAARRLVGRGARKLKLVFLSYFAKLMAKYYRVTGSSRFVHMRKWEEMLEPVLNSDPFAHNIPSHS
jgi:glycosyltransferase involved in cell wall biosynthesis